MRRFRRFNRRVVKGSARSATVEFTAKVVPKGRLVGGIAKQVKPLSRREQQRLLREHKERQARRVEHLRSEQRFETYRAAFIMCAANTFNPGKNIDKIYRDAEIITRHVEKQRPAPFKE